MTHVVVVLLMMVVAEGMLIVWLLRRERYERECVTTCVTNLLDLVDKMGDQFGELDPKLAQLKYQYRFHAIYLGYYRPFNERMAEKGQTFVEYGEVKDG